MLAIVGESGSGKSITSLSILGLLPKTARVSGSVRFRGRELIGLPDRAVALVIPARLPAAETFGRRVLQEWRDAMNPCSREVLRSDGTALTVVERGRRATSLLPWLND